MAHPESTNGRRVMGLSERAVVVLGMIASGRTYEQILATHPDLTYVDIFESANEALGISRKVPVSAMHRARRKHRRAYERWTPAEEAELSALHAAGHSVAEIASALERQRSAVRSRMRRLGIEKDGEGEVAAP